MLFTALFIKNEPRPPQIATDRRDPGHHGGVRATEDPDRTGRGPLVPYHQKTVYSMHTKKSKCTQKLLGGAKFRTVVK